MLTPEVALEWFIRSAPVGLVPATAQGELHRLAARFPRIASSMVLEVHLAPAIAAVDFMFAVTRADTDALVWRQVLQTEPSLLGHARPIEAWLEEPALAKSPLFWFEWDAARGFYAAPLCSFAQTTAVLGTGQHYPRDAQVALAVASARALGFVGEQLDRTLARCKEALPGDCQVVHVTSLRPRGIQRLRLTASLPAAFVPAWLQSVGWPGSLRSAESLLEQLDEPFGRLAVQLELAPQVTGYLAVESRERSSLDAARSHQRLFGWLERKNGFDRARAERCLAWPRRIVSPPAGLDARRLEQTLYFKLVLGESGASEAKAYLGLTPFS